MHMFADRTKVIVSRHARERFKERYFNYYPVHYFYSERFTDSLIQELVKNAVEVLDWRLSAFYRNKVESKYGPTRVFKSQKSMHFLCTPMDNGKLMVRTVVYKFNHRV